MKTFASWIYIAISMAICIAQPIQENTKEVDYRLNRKVLPSFYNLTITPYLLENEVPGKKQFTFDALVKITLKSTENVNEIVLHSKYLTIHDASFENSAIKVSNQSLDTKTDKLTLKLSETLKKGEERVLIFNYTGRMDDDMQGFYRSKYTYKNGTSVWIGSTQFQPVHARRVFPCFDEPQFKAKFQVTISHFNIYHAVSNTAIKEPKKTEGNRTITTFKETPIMSTYLLAFIVSDFNIVGDENEIAVIARKDAESQTNYALEVGKKTLKALEQYLNLNYKSLGNPKMHLAAIPDFSAGAMENWGLLTFRERALLYDKDSTTASAQESIATVIAHEQAHMWFGDYITCAWWNVTWLNEGFARYFEFFATHAVYPEWELDKQFVVKQIQTAFVNDALNDTHPLTNKDTSSPGNVGNMFDTITYNKGASVIRMIKYIIGEENFKSALQKYVADSKLKHSTTLPENLFSAFKSTWINATIDLDLIQKDWTEQVGYPVLNIQLSPDRKSFNITQKRFVLNKNVQQQNLSYTVPFTYATNKNMNFQNTTPDLFILKDKGVHTVTLKEPVDWVIGNKLQTGFYRVNYDINTWHQIHAALGKSNFSNIPEANRAQIVDDLFNFARAGLMKYYDILGVLSYLESETDYLPWNAAFRGFSFLENKLSQQDVDYFKKHVHTVTHKVYEKLGFDERNNDTRLDKHNRVQVLGWACKFNHEECVSKSKSAFSALKHNNTAVPVNIRSVVYCTALREGNESDFKFLWTKYKTETVNTEQVLILGILGCSKNKTLVETLLNYTLSPDIRKQDKSSALSSAYSNNKENVQVVFDYVVNNVEQFKSALGNYSDVASVISNVASRFTTEDQRKQLQKFYDENKEKFGDSAKTLLDSLKNVDDNLAWTKENLSSLHDYLKELYGLSSRTSFSLVFITFTTLIVLLISQ